MLRTVLLIVALVVLIVIGLFWTGVLGVQQKADGTVDVTTNSLQVTTEPRTVQVPVVRTVPEQGAAPANGAAPQ